MVRRSLKGAAQYAFRSRTVAQLVFGVRFQRIDRAYCYFDVSTYVVTRYLRRSLGRCSRIVDMGTGAVAAVGLYLWKHANCRVVSVDIDPELVELARQSIRLNDADVEVVQSDLLTGVHGAFDAVVFNPPYVRTGEGLARGLPERTRSQWDGGAEGVRVIERFLDAVSKLPHETRVFMVLNNWHVDPDRARKCLPKRSTIELDEVYEHWLFPVSVYRMSVRPEAEPQGSSRRSPRPADWRSAPPLDR